MKKALVVGINNYPTDKLKGCINDAKTFSDIIRENGDGSRNFDVQMHIDIASQYMLKDLIIRLFNSDCDTALFYFSGFGYSNGIDSYIVTPDFKPFDNGIPVDEILLVANNSKAINKIIILDCCFSGAFSAENSFSDNTPYVGKGVTIIQSITDLETGFSIDGQKIFSKLLFDALRGGGANMLGHITPTSVYNYIEQAIGVWHQRPLFRTNIIHQISLRFVAPAIPRDIWKKMIEYFPNPDFEFQLDPSYDFTNDPSIEQNYIQPYANSNNVNRFNHLRRLQSFGLVKPVDSDHMYFAAMQSKTCKLTSLGQHYWQLVKEELI